MVDIGILTQLFSHLTLQLGYQKIGLDLQTGHRASLGLNFVIYKGI